METGFYIAGSTPDKEMPLHMATAISEIFEKGFATRQSESVMLKALDVIARATPPDQRSINVHSCSVTDESVTKNETVTKV